ncbi:MAG: hypothetical protein K0R50_1259 [Eubacterium sp.]|jgi:hypothetical protein|nr:hypothetical protein [Eubacterium sp.]
MSKKNKTNLEINNDKLIILQYISGPIALILGTIIIFTIIAALIIVPSKIQANKEEKEQAALLEIRQTKAQSFIDYNEKTFGNVINGYWSENVYIVESDKGKFYIRFVDKDIFNIELTNKSNQTAEIYSKK